jgi:hypothetical protein
MSDTTIPRDTTADAGSSPVPSWAFVLCSSDSQPERSGEVAFLPAFEDVYIGRGDDKIHEFAAFGQHRPGKPLPTSSPEGCLGGQGLSRRQLQVRAAAVGARKRTARAQQSESGAKLPDVHSGELPVLAPLAHQEPV